MPYQPKYQLLAPGSAMMPRANPIPYAQLFANKKWKNEQLDKLADKETALNDSLTNVTASNIADAGILTTIKDGYNDKIDEIKDDPKLSTGEKYRKIQILGNQAKNDPKLNAIADWREAYEKNKKMIEESEALLDEDVSTYAMDALRRKNIIGSIGDEATHVPGMAYSQWTNINPLKTPDLGKRAQEFVKGMTADQALISQGGAVMDDGKGGTLKFDGYGWLRADRKKYVDEDRVMEAAMGYISQAPDVQEWFGQKDQGAEIALRQSLAAEGKTQAEIDAEVDNRKSQFGGTVFDKEAYIKASVDPVAKWGSYSQITPEYKWDKLSEELRAKKGGAEEEVVDDPLPVYTSTNTGVESEQMAFEPKNALEYSEEAASSAKTVLDLTKEIEEMEKYIRDEEAGKAPNDRSGIPATKEQVKLKRTQLGDAVTKQQSVQAINYTFEQEEIRKDGNAGKAISLINDLTPGSYNEATKSFDPFYSDTGRTEEINGKQVTWEEFDKILFGNGSYEQMKETVLGRPGILDIPLDSMGNVIAGTEDVERAQFALKMAQRGIGNLSGANLDLAQTQEALKYSQLFRDIVQSQNVASKGSSLDPFSEEEKAFRKIVDIKREGSLSQKLKDYGWVNSKVDEAVNNGDIDPSVGQAMKALIPGFSGGDNIHLDEILKKAVSVRQKTGNEAFDTYLEEARPSAQVAADIFVSVPDFTDFKGDKAKKYDKEAINYKEVVNDLNNNKGNFTISPRDPVDGKRVPLEPEQTQGIVFEKLTGVGMDDKYVGGTQQLPVQMRGYVLDEDGNKIYQNYIVQGDRSANENFYNRIGDILGAEGLGTDAEQRSRLAYVSNLAKNKDSIGEKFEEIQASTKIGNYNTQDYHLNTGITDAAMTTPQGFLKDEVYSTPKVRFRKTGPQNYQFEGAGSFPLVAMKKAMEQADPSIKEVMKALTPAEMAEARQKVKAGTLDPTSFAVLRSLHLMQLQENYWNNMDGKQEFNSITDAKVWMNNMQKNYIDIFNGLNGPANVSQIVQAGQGYLDGKKVSYSNGKFTVTQ